MGRMVLSDSPSDGAVSLKGSGIRRCKGCVRCLTENPGVCGIDDPFTSTIPDIIASSELVFLSQAVGGRLPLDVLKAVERLSNVLEAYTISGGNVPLSLEGVELETVSFEIHGDIDRGSFEKEMTANLRKGPVKNIHFRYD